MQPNGLASRRRPCPLEIASWCGNDWNSDDLRISPRVPFDEVFLQLGVAVEAGLERQLPLLAGSELAVVPKGGSDRSEDLGACREASLNG